MKQSIRIAALIVAASFAFSQVADAQLGGMLNRARSAIKEAASTPSTPKVKLAIPKAVSGGQTAVFKRGEKEVAKWNPATLELTMTADGAVYKLDPKTGNFTDASGASKGSISADGTVVGPLFGTLQVVQDTNVLFFVNKDGERLGGIVASMGETYFGDRRRGYNGIVSDTGVNPLLLAYVYFGYVFTPEEEAEFEVEHAAAEKKARIKQLGYDPDRTYTTEELYDMIEWKDEEAINEILKYENSLTYAGFRDTHPEFKNCKVGAVGLMTNQWVDNPNATYYWVDYWVVYELTDGRNIVTFSTARKKFRYGDVENRYREHADRFHEVTDWVRKEE